MIFLLNSLNLPTQDLGFAPVQRPYKPFSFPANPYNPLPFLEELDTFPFNGRGATPISLVGATAFQKLIDQGNEVFALSYKPISLPEDTAQL